MKKAVLTLVFLTGFSGLVFQVVWQKYLSLLLGGEALSSALVVAVFLGGLSLGYYLFGRHAARLPAGRLIMRAGLAEIGIGIWAFVFPIFFDFAWAHLNLFPAEMPWRLVSDFLVGILFLSPATILMGSTLPLLTRGISARKSDLSVSHAQIYGYNTLGAFLGALGAGFFLIQYLGLPLTLMTLCSINLAAGVALLVFGAQVPESGDERKTGVGIKNGAAETLKRTSPSTPIAVLILAFLTGFVSIGFEILLMRMVSLAIGTSEYTYSLVVAVFVLMIAYGALSLTKTKTRPVSLLINQLFIFAGLLFVYWTIPSWGQIAHIVRWSLATLPSNFYVYNFLIFLALGAVISVPVFFMGRVMPLLFNYLESDLDSASVNVGKIYAFNAVGCALGGLIMGYGLLIYFDAHIVYRIGVSLCIVGLGIMLMIIRVEHRIRWGFGVAGAGALLMTLMFPSWPQKNLTLGTFRARNISGAAFFPTSEFVKLFDFGSEVIFYRDDPNTTVAVTQYDGDRNLVVNGKSDGATSAGDQLTTSMLGLLPALFTSAPGDAAVIGLGLGNTAYSISKPTWINHVDVYEISHAVVSAAPLFDVVNHGILKNEKVTIHQMDGFRGLLHNPNKLSVVISEPSNPWVSGVDRLYSREFYEIVKSQMHPDGVFCQWMHTYRMSQETLEMVLRTFSSVFPQIKIFSSNGADLIILGAQKKWDDATFEVARKRWDELKLSEIFHPLGLENFLDLALHEETYPLAITVARDEHSLFFPHLSYAAAKDYFLVKEFSLRTMNLFSPILSHYSRTVWKDSLLSYMTRSKNFNVPDLYKACSKNSDRAGADSGSFIFKLDEMDPLCQMWIIALASKGVLKPPASKPNLVKEAKALSLFQMDSDYWDQDLSLIEKVKFLTGLPPWEKNPPQAFLGKLYNQCPKETDSLRCSKDIINLSLKFGYANLAKNWLTLIPRDKMSPIDKVSYLKSLADLSLLQ